MNYPVSVLFGVLTLGCLQVQSPAQGSDDAPLKVLILSGGEGHDWRATTPILQKTLTESGRFAVRVMESSAGLTGAALAPFDVVVDDGSKAGWDAATEQALAAFVESGKGLVVTRNGLAVDRKALTKVSWSMGGTAPFQMLRLTATAHPVTAGLMAPLRTADRPPAGLIPLAGAEVLATTEAGVPVLLAAASGNGRVFCTALGFDPAAMQERTFMTTLARGTEWAATGKVTLPAELALPEPAADALRVLVITGGHDHEASFYGLFEGYRDIAWPQISSSDMAFKEDLRPKYDVIVFYDFSRDLDEKGRKNLQDFVAAGKGLVVLHHAVLSYQTWPWWSAEVVGGRYRLSREGSIPNSTVKMGQEHLITPAGDHPITASVGAFHITDETYHGLWISPNIKPLLNTDNPTSDPVVGWIGPCTTSRVVYLQLGHDHSPFRHPSYRALVHRSILWTGDKLP